MSMDTGSYGIGSGPSSIGPIQDFGTGATISQTTSIDTMSQAEIAVMAYALMAGFPMLPPPNFQGDASINGVDNRVGFNPELFVMQMQGRLAQIGNDLLDRWSASLREQEEADRRYRESDAYRLSLERNSAQFQINQENRGASSIINSPTYQTYIESRDAPYLAQAGRTVLSEGINNYLNAVKNQDPAAVGALPFVIANFIVPGALVSGVVDVTSASQVASNLSVDSSFYTNLIANQNLMIPSDMRAELGLLGAIFAGGALTYAEAVNTGEALGGQKPHDEKNLALNFGQKVIGLVRSGDLDNFLKIFYTTKTENGQPLSDEKVQERIAVLKLTLIATALMAIYKSEAKYLTGDDFLGMINGTTQPRSETEAQLVASFRALLPQNVLQSLQGSSVSLSAHEELLANLVRGLGGYADKNPDFSSFFKVDNAFASIAERISVIGNA